MSKVLVDRELLERILNWREGDAGDSGRDELIDILAAQPAEAEGVKVVAWLNTATEAVTVHPVQVMDWDDESEPVEPLVRQSDHLAALSAVTAERDAANSRLHEVAVACATAEQERDQLRAEAEALRKDAERYRWLRDQAPKARGEWEIDGQRYGMMLGADQDDVDEAVDALMSAMSAKEA